jgi:superfamily I DNA/RNA helicase
MRLTTEQQRAIESDAPHKRIIAVAGSGKTRVLVAQVGQWIQDGVDPSTLAVITFTRRAAEELRVRITAEHNVLLGFCGTVHGMAYQAMALALDGRHRWTPLTDEETKAVIYHIARERKMLSAVCSKVVKAVCGLEDLMALQKMKATQVALTREVMGYMRQHRLAHVGEMVRLFLFSIRNDPEMLQWIRRNAETILWDEFQDTDSAQASLMELIAPRRSMVVGDPAQAIYGFAGASAMHLLDRNVETFRLSYSFRSATKIIDVANRQLGRADLLAVREDEGWLDARPNDDPFPTGDNAVAKIAEAIIALRGVDHGPVTVLCRTNREIAVLRDFLKARRPDWTTIVASPGFDWYAHEPWPDLFLACRAIIAPRCDWLASAMDRIGKDWTDFLHLDPTKNNARDVLKVLAPHWSAAIEDPALDLSILEFVSWYIRRDLESLLPVDSPDVLIMTAHAAKGLEWPSVILAGVGHSMGRTGTKNDQEERNLLYVAITRAKDQLALVGDSMTLLRLTGERDV